MSEARAGYPSGLLLIQCLLHNPSQLAGSPDKKCGSQKMIYGRFTLSGVREEGRSPGTGGTRPGWGDGGRSQTKQ